MPLMSAIESPPAIEAAPIDAPATSQDGELVAPTPEVDSGDDKLAELTAKYDELQASHTKLKSDYESLDDRIPAPNPEPAVTAHRSHAEMLAVAALGDDADDTDVVEYANCLSQAINWEAQASRLIASGDRADRTKAGEAKAHAATYNRKLVRLKREVENVRFHNGRKSAEKNVPAEVAHTTQDLIADVRSLDAVGFGEWSGGQFPKVQAALTSGAITAASLASAISTDLDYVQAHPAWIGSLRMLEASMPDQGVQAAGTTAKGTPANPAIGAPETSDDSTGMPTTSASTREEWLRRSAQRAQAL